MAVLLRSSFWRTVCGLEILAMKLMIPTAVEKEIPAVVVAGTGRLSDVIAGFRKLAKKSSKPTTVAEMMAEAQRVNRKSFV